jgi:hypothetical protein
MRVRPCVALSDTDGFVWRPLARRGRCPNHVVFVWSAALPPEKFRRQIEAG